MTKGLRRPSGSNIFAVSFKRDLLVTGSERAKSIRSAKLKRNSSDSVFQLVPRTLTCLSSRFSFGPVVALAYDLSCVKLGSALGNSDSTEDLKAPMTSLLFDRHFRKLKPPSFTIVFEFWQISMAFLTFWAPERKSSTYKHSLSKFIVSVNSGLAFSHESKWWRIVAPRMAGEGRNCRVRDMLC